MGYQASVILPAENYTYGQMIRDLETLERLFPDMLRVDSIGLSEEGRELALAAVGASSAEKRIFISAAIHAREHMTAALAMAQIEDLLTRAESASTTAELLHKVCFHIVPMANPDGVFISQSGILPQKFQKLYSGSDAKRWKANALGIDLNSNFDGNWASHSDRGITCPAPEGFKGNFPECAAESKALADHIRAVHFDMTLSYHTTGSEIYYCFGENKINKECEGLARAVAAVTGFGLCRQSPQSCAGLKDWAIDKLSIPSLTIEFGRLPAPHALHEFYAMWESAKDIPCTAAEWLLARG